MTDEDRDEARSAATPGPDWRLSRGPLANWIFDDLVVKKATDDEIRAFARQAMSAHMDKAAALRDFARECSKLIRDLDVDPVVAAETDMVLHVAIVLNVRPFDWAAPPWFGAVYHAKDDEEWRALGGSYLNPGQEQSHTFVNAEVVEVDRYTGVAMLLLNHHRLGSIRGDELKDTLQPATLKDVPFDASRWPLPPSERKPGHWSA